MIPNLWCFLCKMSVGLAVLGIVNAITIDTHLITTKNDCYERLALGQRLDSRDVFRTISTPTVADCQKECSAEDHKCLSLSFGIDLKGNGTCELSFITIKETADLQPIGTIKDPDYDLYIKKVDCKLNIPKDPPLSDSLAPDNPPRPIVEQDDPQYSSSDHQRPNPYRPNHQRPQEGSQYGLRPAPYIPDHQPDPYRPDHGRPIQNRPQETPGYSSSTPQRPGPYGLSHLRPEIPQDSLYPSPPHQRPVSYRPDQRPVEVHKPTYMVSILDSRPGRPQGPARPGSHGSGYGLYLEPGNHKPNPDRNGRPPYHHSDLLIFYDDRKPQYGRPNDLTAGPYENYYDVPRPLPQMPYGDDQVDPYRKPISVYPNDQFPYGIPKPGHSYGLDKRPSYYNDYFGDKHPLPAPNRPGPYENRPLNRPYGIGADFHNPDNPNVYDNKRPLPVNNYGPEPDRFGPDRPNSLDTYGERPHIPERPSDSYPSNAPDHIYDHRIPANNRPYGSDRPFRPEPDRVRPYGPERPLGPEPDRNRPYPEPDQNSLYGAERPFGPEPDRNRPYGVEPDRDSPYNPNRIDRPFRPEPEHTRPYGPEPEHRPERPYGPQPEHVRPYGPEPEHIRPYGPEPEHIRPYGPKPEHRPYRPERPYGPEPDPRPFVSETDRKRPYGPDPMRPEGPFDSNWIRPYGPEPERPHNPRPFGPDRNRPYGPEANRPYGLDPDRPRPHLPDFQSHISHGPDIKRPFIPEVDQNRPYFPSAPAVPNSYDNPRHPLDQNRPYGPDIQRPYVDKTRPYIPSTQNSDNSYDNQRPVFDRPQSDTNRPYPDQNRPYPPVDRPLDKPYGLGSNQKKPISNNNDSKGYDRHPLHERPNTDWDRISSSNPPNNPDNPNSNDAKAPGDYNSKPADATKGSSGYGDKSSVQNQATPEGGTVTSIITQIVEPCYRRVLAGNRIIRNYIKRAVPCERVEDCQRECQQEKRFVCEGFNYRLDPSGRAQGDCELTDLPVSRLDPRRDIIPDRDYDFYEKDRDSGPDCRPLPYGGRPGGGYPPSSGGHGWPGHGPGPGYPPSSPGVPRPPHPPYPPSGGGYPPSVGGYPPSGGRYPPSDHRYPPSGGGRYPPSGGHIPAPRPIDRYPLPPSGPPGGGTRYPAPHDYGRLPPYDDGRKGLGPVGPPSPHYDYPYPSVDRQDHHYNYGYHYPVVRPQYPYSHRDSVANDWPTRDRPVLHYPDLPPRHKDPPSHHYDPHYRYQDSYYHDRERDRTYWGINEHTHKWGYYGGTYGNFGGPDTYYGGGVDRRNQNRHDYDRRPFVPYRIGQTGGPQDWGQYGGSYGTGTPYSGQRDSFNYWGFDRYHPGDVQGDKRPYYPTRPGGSTSLVPHGGGPYLPMDHYNGGYGHYPGSGSSSHFDDSHIYGHGGHSNHIGYDTGYPSGGGGSSYPRDDDCSTRRGMGFRLHKAVVKKFYAVPNIHECEKLCYMEKDFICVSFSYRTDDNDETSNGRIVNEQRYSITLSSPSDNCYLSDRPYKELDLYTDLEPDRDFDIYTMHKSQSCLIPVVEVESECFLRVRSGQRLDHSAVRDSMDVKSIVDCQLECLTSKRFTCRAFSYRYGAAYPGGSIDNCQLSDWPYVELDPRKDLIPEPGYEIYERGSYGHGCEHDHFTIPGHHGIGDGSTVPKHSDKICYVGYAKPARLTTEAAKGALSVSTELDCKAECTRAREETEFPCMSFSYRNLSPKEEPNCELSDIEQRDLLPDLDYRRDPDAWLFAWDNYNPQCLELAVPGRHRDGPKQHHGPYNALDTWSVYSVSGWPCRRGTTCQENREAGFWSCELEGGDVGSWDYCCRPDHKCGFSQGYGYPWCYVGPSRDQWRKCSDRYYPYSHQKFPSDKHDQIIHTKPHFGPASYEPYLPKPSGPPGPSYKPLSSHPGPSWYAERPYRPPYGTRPQQPRPPRPSLTQYEDKFHQQFLDPPKPGGFEYGPARHWPVSYLHKELPPNVTVEEEPDRQTRKMNKKNYNEFRNTIKINKTKVDSDDDDIFFVRLPMPDMDNSAKMVKDEEKILKFDVVDMKTKKPDDFDDLFLISVPKSKNKTDSSGRQPKRDLQMFPVMRRGFVTRTNRTERKRRIRPEKEVIHFYND